MVISIIIPTYNRSKTILRSIKSVLDQEYTNWELVIVDDASTDNTADIIKPYLADERIQYYGSSSNGGNAVARNRGASLSKGDIITFLDSDDEYLPNYLSTLNEFYESNPKVEFSWTGVIWNRNGKITKSSAWQPLSRGQYSFFYQLRIGTGCGLAMKSYIAKENPFNENLRAAVDTEFLLRISMKYHYKAIDIPYVVIYAQENSVRKNKSNLAYSYKIIIDSFQEIIFTDQFLVNKFYYKLIWLNFHAKIQFNSNNYLKFLRGGTYYKAIFIKILFNILPYSLALTIHKKLV